MKINTVNMSLILFNGENKIYKWVSDSREQANLRIMATHSQKKGDTYDNYSIPVVVWGKADAIERIEAKLYKSLSTAPNNNGIQKIEIAVINGSLGGDLKEMTDSKGRTYSVTTPQINVNLSQFTTMIINPDFEVGFSYDGARSMPVAGHSGTNVRDDLPKPKEEISDVKLEEIKF